MKSATQNRLKVFYVVFAPVFLVLCLACTVAVILTSESAIFATPLAVPTSIGAWMVRRCADWLT